MCHHDRADEARADAPRRRVAELALVVLVGKRDVVGAREVLAEVVRRAHLQRQPITHESFDRQRVDGPWERLGRRFLATQYRNRQPVLGDRPVVTEDELRLLHRLLSRGVEGVPLLPPELAAAQEQARAHLPPHDAVPLVRQLGQVAMTLDVALDQRADDRFRGRPHRERLFELLHIAAGPRHPRNLRREALDMLGFLHQIRPWDEKRECPVLVPALFDHVVEGARDRLPHRPSIRTDDHHSAYA